MKHNKDIKEGIVHQLGKTFLKLVEQKLKSLKRKLV
jgi:hypothetical protein